MTTCTAPPLVKHEYREQRCKPRTWMSYGCSCGRMMSLAPRVHVPRRDRVQRWHEHVADAGAAELRRRKTRGRPVARKSRRTCEAR